jgi:hypothetical protein
VRDPESVAEHTARVAQPAALLAAEEGGNPERAACLALWHDTQETRAGDLPHTVKPYLTKPDPEHIIEDQTAVLPDTSRDSVRHAVGEYETADTLEARCARDADKLEMLPQAAEYRDLGVTRVPGLDRQRRQEPHDRDRTPGGRGRDPAVPPRLAQAPLTPPRGLAGPRITAGQRPHWLRRVCIGPAPS